MSEEEKKATVPYFVHEGVMARMERIFRLTVCALVVALAISVISFVVNDTLWRKYCQTIEAHYRVEENDAGIHEQSNPGNHP